MGALASVPFVGVGFESVKGSVVERERLLLARNRILDPTPESLSAGVWVMVPRLPLLPRDKATRRTGAGCPKQDRRPTLSPFF